MERRSGVQHTRRALALPVADSLLRGRRFPPFNARTHSPQHMPEDIVNTTDVRNISVRLHWDSWQAAHVAIEDLQDIHWANPRARRASCCTRYVSCARIPPGVLPTIARRATRRTRLLVCILKGHTPAMFMRSWSAGRRCGVIGRPAGAQTMMPLRTA